MVNGKTIRLTQERDPANLKWDEVGADVVIEATGLFLDKASARKAHRRRRQEGAHVGPLQGRHPHVRLRREPRRPTPARPSSPTPRCTTNCLAPVAKVLNDKWGIKRGLMTTVHAATATQKTVDGPSNKDWRGGRGILENIIPQQHWRSQGRGRGDSGAEQKAHRHVLPRAHLRRVGGGLDRRAGKEADYKDICAEMKAQSEGALKGVLAYTEDKVVATDFPWRQLHQRVRR